MFRFILSETDNFPPETADTEPDDQVDRDHDKSKLPPLALTDKARAVKNRSRAAAVVRQRNHNVRQCRKCYRRQKRRRANDNRHGQKCRIHCADVCRTTRKAVMRINVNQNQNYERREPRQARRLNCTARQAGNRFDESRFI